MLLSRLRPANKKVTQKKVERKIPELDEFLNKRDYSGAVPLIKFHDKDELTELWLGYCYFHAGEYKKASEMYEEMLKRHYCPDEVHIYAACAYFFLGLYFEAKDAAEAGPKSQLKNRLLFHVSHKIGDEKRLMHHHSQLQDSIEDQLSLASIHYLRSHFQEALDIYKSILSKNSKFIALNVYLAMCYYKLDYYDLSLETLQPYLSEYPDSMIAINIRACNQYKLYNGKVAEKELHAIKEQSISGFSPIKDLITHNSVVFREGDTALQTIPSLIGILPEARLNLIIFHLKRDDLQAAMNLAVNLEPQTPTEFLLKAITYCITGYQKHSAENLKIAIEYFKNVGGSAAECDTIVGRQAMASAYFLMEQFEEVLIYLNSIKSFFYNDDTFNFNIGQALLYCNNTVEAESALLLVTEPQLKKQLPYILCLARAYVHNKKASLAWEIYCKMKQSEESLALLRVIANDCYRLGDYYYSAKAFDAMERIEPNPEYWEGKRGAVVGVFKMIVERKAPPEQLTEAMILLEKSRHPQVEYIANVIRNFCEEYNIII